MSNYDDFSDYQPPKDSFASPVRKQRGCLFYGCLISGILAALLVLAIGIGSYFAYQAYSKFITDNTSDAPAALPQSPLGEEDQKTLFQEFDALHDVATGKGEKKEAEISLTTDQLNALIQRHPNFEKLKDMIAVSIEGDKIKCQVSFSLEKFNIPLGKGRFFNGEGELEVSMKDRRLEVYLDQIKVKGVAVPEEFQRGIRNENLAKGFNDDPDLVKKLESIQSIEVKDGKLVIKVKTAGAAAPATDPKAKEAGAADKKEATPAPAPAPDQKSDAKAEESKKSPADAEISAPGKAAEEPKTPVDGEKPEKTENSPQKKAA